MSNNNKRKMKFFNFLYIIIIIAVWLLGTEGIVYLFSKTNRISLATRGEITSMSEVEMESAKIPDPVYIPHPYFGYVYRPNSHISQFNYVSNTPVDMKSNSDGFIDEEFPVERKEGLCIYGIFGGSAAMSWGMNNREDHISYHLEKLLNTYLRDDKYKEYRVLNLGIGSYTLYQAMQIYLYYKDLLDGVIFYGGFNECAHGAMLTNDDPVQFPVINLYASLQSPSFLILKISEKRHELVKIARFLTRHTYLIYSPTVRFLFKLKVLGIERLQSRLQDEGHRTILPSIKGKYKKELQSIFPGLTALNYLQSYDYDNPDIPKIIEKILPLVWTEPIINANAVAKTNKTHFLNVIQPMMYITDAGAGWWKERNFASYYFQKCCNEKLMEEAKKLEVYGIKTYNLNETEEGAYKKDFFIDHVHLKKEGTKFVAHILFEIIKKQWHK